MDGKNSSQLEDLRRSELDQWKKRVGHQEGNPSGIETPLGHTYSMISEALAEQ